MGGTVEVKSKINSGTEVTVMLPLQGAAENDEVLKKPAVRYEMFAGKHALLIEDNDINAEIALLLLGDAGVITDRAADGKAGLEMFAGSTDGYYDFILMDIRMTGALVKPLDLGADIVVSSLTKFANGHSDAVCGAVTGAAKYVDKAYELQVLLGTQSDPFSSWLVCRGIRTLNLRVRKQAENAAALAKMFEESEYVEAVYHPSLESHPQHGLWELNMSAIISRKRTMRYRI